MNKKKFIKILKNIYPYIIIVVVVVLIRSFIITPALVDGKSMYPTLDNGNVILLNKLRYKVNGLKRFDIVVVNYDGRKLVKRVIGLPGEHVEYKDNGLYIDGFLTEENFKHEDTADYNLNTLGYLTIPGDYYFVVGDNRVNSSDSRSIGLINKKDILGISDFRLFPLNHLGKIK